MTISLYLYNQPSIVEGQRTLFRRALA